MFSRARPHRAQYIHLAGAERQHLEREREGHGKMNAGAKSGSADTNLGELIVSDIWFIFTLNGPCFSYATHSTPNVSAWRVRVSKLGIWEYTNKPAVHTT